eukprot:Colp12_sorted_trinity150504_noHs@34913
MMAKSGILALLLLGLLASIYMPVEAKLRDGDCEVCINVLKKVQATVSAEKEHDMEHVQSKIVDYCKKAKDRENRFCYYIGGTADAATGMLREASRPLSSGVPPEKICERLKKKDSQICELRYEKQIDIKSVDLKKLRVKDLKKILADWGEVCDDCLEKGDFIKRINVLRPKYEKDEL